MQCLAFTPQVNFPIIWIYTEVEGDGIESRLPSKIFSTLTNINAKGQIISECPLEILDFPKIPPKIWQISALESKKGVKS